jgi:thymidylate kinase
MPPRGERHAVSRFAAAMEALESTGVAFRLRKAIVEADGVPEDRELDLWLQRRDVAAADAALRTLGFHPFRLRGLGRHRFYLGRSEGQWLKLDMKVAAPGPVARWDRSGAARVWRAFARRMPVALRRLGPVVAVLGPDGSGKGTVITALQQRVPVAVVLIYMGGRRQSRSGRSGPKDRSADVPAPQPGRLREIPFVAFKWARAWRRLASAYLSALRGHIVICDRHPLEILAVRPARSRPAAALERFLAKSLTPRPDAMVILDAPAEVLHGRKPEHSITTLERWRRGYDQAFRPPRAIRVSTVGPQGAAVDRISDVVWEALRTRRRW